MYITGDIMKVTLSVSFKCTNTTNLLFRVGHKFLKVINVSLNKIAIP